MLKIRTQKQELQIKPKAVLIDLDHTLYDYDSPHAKAMSEVRDKMKLNLGLNGKRFDHVFDLARKQVKERLGKTASSHSRLLYFQRFLELCGMKSDVVATLDYEQTYWRTFLSSSKLFPNARETLLLIRSLDIPLVLLTDLNARIQFRKIVYFGLETVFDYVVTSEEVGADKPDSRMFQTAIEKLGLQAGDRFWMIGDHDSKDGAGAKAHLNALFFHRQTRILGGTASNADLEFDRFDELAKLIESIVIPAK